VSAVALLLERWTVFLRGGYWWSSKEEDEDEDGKEEGCLLRALMRSFMDVEGDDDGFTEAEAAVDGEVEVEAGFKGVEADVDEELKAKDSFS
jgi:hypothetical protein